METGTSQPELKMKNGIVIKKSVAALLGVFFVCAIVGTGVLVHYYSPDTPTTFDTEKGAAKFSNKQEGDADLRLPSSLTPSHYVIRIQPFVSGEFNFSTKGYVTITFKVVEPTSTVTFHMLDIITVNETIKLVPTDDLNGDGLQFTSHVYDVRRQFYIGSLAAELEVGKSYTISMHYIGYLNDVLLGFYRSSYEEQGKQIYLGTTHFEATSARKAFPCFDEPALKATFDISMAREEGMGVISNMPKISSIAMMHQPGWYWDKFNTTLPVSTYLVAFIVSDFVSKSSNENDHVLFRVWARREAIYQADYALDIGPEVLTFFEGYFNIPFPLPKQDMAALPDFKMGAMENWGLIIYRETALLYDPQRSAASNKQRVGVAIAHELAHQWFGDLVTPSWWNDLWLNEGFASYMENIALDPVEPTFQMLEQFVSNELQNVFSMDCLESSHPISVEVEDPDQITQIFDSISYSKGASIIRMMKYYLTESTFRQGLTNYLNEFRYSSAEQDDLWFYLTEQAHVDGTLDKNLSVKEIMDTWTLQMGYPVVTVTRNDDGTALVTQERFLLAKSNSMDTHKYMWWIPLTYTSEDSPDFSQTTVMEWMNNTEKEKTLTGFPSKDKWVIFNIQENGYYRVNYDTENWNELIKQLVINLKAISTINRAQIVDDALDLARAGFLDYNIALDVNTYLKEETELVPWYSAIDNLDYLKVMFTRTSGYGALKNYLLASSIPLYNSVGFDDSLNDPHVEQLKRAAALSWTCALQYEPCLDNSTQLFNQWMANPDNCSIISPNLKTTVYCNGIAEGDETQWDFAWKSYLTSNLGTDKDSLLYGMGCSKVPWILQRYLEMAFTEGSGIRMQDAYKVFNSVATNDYGRDIAWAYLQSQWNNIGIYYGNYENLGEFTYTVTSSFNTEQEFKELEQLKEDHYADLGTGTQSFDQAMENVNNNVDWLNNYYEIINQWLIDHGYGDNIGHGTKKLPNKSHKA